MGLHRPAQILFRFFVGLHYNVIMKWEEYYRKKHLRDIAVNVFTIGFRSKIAQILTHFWTKIFLRALNLSRSKRWFNYYHVMRL